MSPDTMQDENKKLDDTEKKARLIVNERLDSLLYDIQDVMAAKGNPRNEKVDIDLDEAYGPTITMCNPAPSCLLTSS
jgi:hypothetical protein